MLSRIRRLPSPALVISTIALIVAVGGGTAALALTDNQKDKKIANRQITKRAPGLSVKHAKTANPIAYAHVNDAGTVQANSRGVAQANVTHLTDGTYCFHDLAFTPKGGQVTIDGGDSADQIAQLGIGAGSSGCAAGTQAFIYTITPPTTVDAGFFVMFYR